MLKASFFSALLSVTCGCFAQTLSQPQSEPQSRPQSQPLSQSLSQPLLQPQPVRQSEPQVPVKVKAVRDQASAQSQQVCPYFSNGANCGVAGGKTIGRGQGTSTISDGKITNNGVLKSSLPLGATLPAGLSSLPGSTANSLADTAPGARQHAKNDDDATPPHSVRTQRVSRLSNPPKTQNSRPRPSIEARKKEPD